MINEEADKYLGHYVKIYGDTIVKLIAIYPNVYETSAGFVYDFEPTNETKGCVYDAAHAAHLPIDFHHKEYVFSNGVQGKIKEVYFNTPTPYVDMQGNQHSIIMEV